MKVVLNKVGLKWCFTIISFIIFLLTGIQSINEPLSDFEIKAIGTGFEIIYNIDAEEKFAILEPPLPGIISYAILKSFYIIEDISYMPSGNYFNIVSFMFALETSKVIGQNIVSLVGEKNCKIIRYINIIWLVIILFIVLKHNIIIGGLLMLFLYPLQTIIMTSTNQTLSLLLVILTLEIMSSIMQHFSYLKYILLGVIVGLLIAVSGSDGILLAGMAIVSVIIWTDIKQKKMHKGFKKKYLIGYLITCFSLIFVVWICYGMDLVCLCQLESLLGLPPTNAIRIIPFFDSMKQIIFEIIFPMDNHQYSFLENISIFFNVYNIIITILSLLMVIKVGSQYGIFSIVLLLSISIYNNINPEKINVFLQINAMLLVTITTLQIGRLLKINSL